MKRRTLLSLAAAGTLSAITPVWAAKKPKPLKILILGGTRFIGLHMTALALERGHTLTYFNRDKTKTDRYREVERIKGDRARQIGLVFDAVPVDRLIDESLRLLRWAKETGAWQDARKKKQLPVGLSEEQHSFTFAVARAQVLPARARRCRSPRRGSS